MSSCTRYNAGEQYSRGNADDTDRVLIVTNSTLLFALKDLLTYQNGWILESLPTAHDPPSFSLFQKNHPPLKYKIHHAGWRAIFQREKTDDPPSKCT